MNEIASWGVIEIGYFCGVAVFVTGKACDLAFRFEGLSIKHSYYCNVLAEDFNKLVRHALAPTVPIWPVYQRQKRCLSITHACP